MPKTFIVVRTQFEGMHYFADAPEPVKFLRQPHRHVFHVEVQIEVGHQDRELEFFIIQNSLNSYLRTTSYPEIHELHTTKGSPLSCEHIANYVRQFLHHCVGDRIINVLVSEDGENGAWVREDLQ